MTVVSAAVPQTHGMANFVHDGTSQILIRANRIPAVLVDANISQVTETTVTVSVGYSIPIVIDAVGCGRYPTGNQVAICRLLPASHLW